MLLSCKSEVDKKLAKIKRRHNTINRHRLEAKFFTKRSDNTAVPVTIHIVSWTSDLNFLKPGRASLFSYSISSSSSSLLTTRVKTSMLSKIYNFIFYASESSVSLTLYVPEKCVKILHNTAQAQIVHSFYNKYSFKSLYKINVKMNKSNKQRCMYKMS